MDRRGTRQHLRGMSQLSELNPRLLAAKQMKAEIRQMGGSITTTMYTKGRVIVQYVLHGRTKQLKRQVPG